MTGPKISLPQFPKTEVSDDEIFYRYAIIDCAHFDACFYKMFIKNEHIKCQSLLADTLYARSSEAGPLLVLIEEDNPQYNPIIDEILFAQIDKPAVMWFWSTVNFFFIKNYLKELMFVQTEDDNTFFLRYYDPRCFKNILKILKSDANILRYLQKIESWAFYIEGQYHYIVDYKDI